MNLALLKFLVPHLKSLQIEGNTIILRINKNYLIETVKILKQSSFLKFSQLLDIWGVDYPHKTKRFEVNYLLLSNYLNYRVILKVSLKDFDSIPSLKSLYNSTNWLEREVWDMYGIRFSNNNDLRRILTDYGFEGYPLRKDYPLTGYQEVRYDDSKKQIVEEPLEMSQEYRNFNFKSPWEKL